MKKNYQFLNNINFPSDLRKVSENNLQKVADEVREEMISAVSETGGVYQVLQKDLKVSMTHLEQHIVQHLFHLH